MANNVIVRSPANGSLNVLRSRNLAGLSGLPRSYKMLGDILMASMATFLALALGAGAGLVFGS